MRRFRAARADLYLDVVLRGQVTRTIQHLPVEGVQRKIVQKMDHGDANINCPLDDANRVEDRLRPAVLNRPSRPRERPGTDPYSA